MPKDEPSDKKNNGLFTIVGSILAAAIGVQSNKNRERDFETKSIWPYVFGGIVFTVGFIVVLVTIVKFILANSA